MNARLRKSNMGGPFDYVRFGFNTRQAAEGATYNAYAGGTA